MKKQDRHSTPTRQVRLYALLAILGWSLLCGTVLFLIYRTGQDEILSDARVVARTSIDKDIAFRHWVAEKGGVYAATGRNTPPNPYLNASERDITTPSGRQLTLVNPAYMTRQMFEQELKLKTSLNSHITSLKPLRPENVADQWEAEALLSFEQGRQEFGTLWHSQGTPAFRYMRPLLTEKSCLRCHADQGYKVGDIRGGISVIVSLGELLAAQNHHFQHIASFMAGVWLIGVIGILVSLRKIFRSTVDLQQERDNMQLLFEAAPNGLLLFNQTREIVKSNIAFRETFTQERSPCGRGVADIINCVNEPGSQNPDFGENCSECSIHTALQAAFSSQLATYNNECPVQGNETDESARAFLFSVTPLQFDGDDGALLVLSDISEQKAAEQERETFRSQLHQSQKIEAIGRLAGGVAHDFNNMLAIILGNTQLALQRLDMGKPVEKYLQQIEETANRSADLTRQLLGFARKQTIAPQVINLNNTIEDMLKMLRQLIGEDIELIWKPAPLDAKLLIDPSQLNQVLTNLAINARDAIKTTGTLVISTDLTLIEEDYCQDHPWCTCGTYVQLSVSDDGCGMSKEIMEHIFEPFYTTKDINKGTGLGLATVYGIVKQNNGFLNVYSEPDQGTTVRTCFPQVSKDLSRKTVQEEKTPVRGDETVLLVEDEEKLLEIERRMLEGAGYQVIASSDPLEALQLAVDYDKPIDLLLTDVIMPKLNGKELAERLLVARPEVKVAYMSGYAADIVATRGLLDAGVQLLQKPFSAGTLTRKLREVLDR